MTPLKVIFQFQSPLVLESEYPIHLDALLAWCEAQEAEAAGSDTPWQDAQDLSHLLDPHGDGDDMVWKASRLVFTPMSERHKLNMIRKTDPEAIMEDYDAGRFTHSRPVTRVDTRSGQSRAYQMLVPYQWMERAEAWAIGDEDEIRERLSLLKHVGKMGRNGFGIIKSIEVLPCPEAQDLWKIRVLPQGSAGAPGVEYVPAMHCLRAPYWEKTNRIIAVEPVV